MNRTKIDWPGLAYSWNPIVGCANGCNYCYAKRISDRFHMIPEFRVPVFFHNRLLDPYIERNPSTIFVGSMCDIFSEGVDIEWINRIIKVADENAHHKFMFLTKKPERYKDFNWPSNCWLGTTIESITHIDRAYNMLTLPNRIFVSIEPIQGIFDEFNFAQFDQIIIGADSSRGAQIPPLEWIKSIKNENIWYKKNLRKHYPELTNI